MADTVFPKSRHTKRAREQSVDEEDYEEESIDDGAPDQIPDDTLRRIEFISGGARGADTVWAVAGTLCYIGENHVF